MSSTEADLIPGAVLNSDLMPGHWLLARLGKKVVRARWRRADRQAPRLLAIDIGPTTSSSRTPASVK